MYSFEEYSKVQDYHITGLKTLHQKVTYPRISVNNEPNGYLKPTGKSFSAYFNKRGHLIYFLNRLKRAPYKCSYFYDNFGRLIKVIECKQLTNQLRTVNSIIYNDDDNFIENIRKYIGSPFEGQKEIHHSIVKGISCIEQKFVPMDDWYLHQTLRYDNIVEEIFDTNRDWQDVTISEFNKNKQIFKSYNYSLEYGEHGEVKEGDSKFDPSDYYLHAYDGSSGLIKSESYISKEPWTKTYQYKFNEKGHWVQKITLLDDSLQFICERNLIYF